jgi:hypothetical protein
MPAVYPGSPLGRKVCQPRSFRGRALNRLSIPTVLLCCACAPSTAPSAVEATVDVLDYLVGDPSLWPRVGNHYSNQVLDAARREVCWVKYANPQRFECWRWDDAFIYHAVDHALDGDLSESYNFTDGRWLPRYLTGTWSLDAADNRIVWFDPWCRIDAGRSGVFPYRQRAWLETRRDAGGDLGMRDTVVLEYAPYDPASGRSVAERFYFARGAGWYRWQREGADLSFNRRGGPAVPMNRAVWCEAPP